MGKKKTKYEKKSFESTGVSSDTSANIYMSMLTSPAWKKLSSSQQKLYVYCKAQYYAEKKKPEDNPEYFTMNKSKWCSLYELYTEFNAKGFYRDIEALIEYGFVRCVSSGKTTREKSIYSYSDNWQKYGTKDFNIPYEDMNTSLAERKRKEKERQN